ncbi:hypothetical protein HRbin31_00306 [bacterium HR31]|nr:hypothetical protein HRbin31_00306 [bacterium HR31]
MAVQHRLHLHRGDVLAAADDDVLLPVDDLEVAVRVHHRQVPGVEPPARERLRGGLRIPVVAVHDGGPPHHDLPHLAAVPRHGGQVLPDHRHLPAQELPNALPGLAGRPLLQRESVPLAAPLAHRQPGPRLGEPVHVNHFNPQLVLRPGDEGCRRRRPAHVPAQLLARPPAPRRGVVQEHHQHRGRGERHGDPLLVDQAEHLRRVHLRQAHVPRARSTHRPHRAPAVHVEHGQHVQVDVVQPQPAVHHQVQHVEGGVAVGEDDSFRVRGGPAGVVQGDGRRLVQIVHLLPDPCRRGGGDPVQQGLRPPFRQLHHLHPVYAVGQGAGHFPEARVHQEQARPGVAQDVLVVCLPQTGVEGHQDTARERGRGVHLQGPPRVGRKDGHPVSTP